MGRKKRKIKFSLRYKIAILIFSLIIITMGVVFSYTINMNINMQEAEIKRNAKKAAESLSALRLVTMGAGDDVNWKVYEKFMEILSKLDRNIILMAVLDKNKKIKAFSINHEVVKRDFKEIKTDGVKEPDLIVKLLDDKIPDSLKVQMPITIKGSDFAGVVIKFSKKANNRRINIMILNMIILTVILLGSGFAGAWFLSKFITSNFNIIAAGMRKVAEGNLHVEVDVKANDEVGVLADDFNRMIVELREKVRIKDAFESVADGLRDMDDLKKAYKVLTYQEMTEKITRGYVPPVTGGEAPAVFVFIDISSFSSFTYELVSEEMKEIIEKFVEKVSMTALEYQGAVFKVTDSYVLICFGYPFRHEDDMKRAIISTVEIRRELVSMVKGKLTLGYDIEDFTINFVMTGGTVIRNFIGGGTTDRYAAVVDYLKFASKYREKKKYETGIYATADVVKSTDNLAIFEKIDSVTMSSGEAAELFRLKGTKF